MTWDEDPKRTSEAHTRDLDLRGAMSPTGVKWLAITRGATTGWVRHDWLSIDERAAKLSLVRQGITLIGSAWRDACECASEIDDFPPGNIAEATGWIGSSFVLPDGSKIVPDGGDPPVVAFVASPNKCVQAGTLDGWTQTVVRPLLGQTLPLFFMMVPFAPPLLEIVQRNDNFGFDVHGGKGIGKSLLARLMATVVGSPIKGPNQYGLSFDATLDGLEQEMSRHSSMPMIINETNLFYAGESEAVRAKKLKAVAFRFGEGNEKLRYGGGGGGAYRFVYVCTSNEPFSDLLRGEKKAVADAAEDRNIGIRVGTDRPFGVFDSVPDHYSGSAEYAKALERGAAEHHGHALRKFLQRLVEAKADDPDRLRREIEARIARFRSEAGVDPNDAGRVPEAFGLVYAAGDLAKSYGLLPEELWCGPVVLDCYRRFYGAPEPAPSFDDQLKDYLARPAVRDLDKHGLVQMGKRIFRATPAFIKRNRKGEQEVMIWPPNLDQHIPGWQTLCRAEGTLAKLSAEKGRNTSKRSVRLGVPEDRMVCFVIPDDYLG